MDRQKVVNTVLGAVLKKGQEEVSSLIGQPVEFTDSKTLESVRENLFEGLQEQQVLAELKVEGDRSGTAWLIADFRDALILGGTLIMLPENELEERLKKGELGEDEADAFGEIVNIMAGVISGLFDELFPDNLRFVKTGVELINPLKVVAKEEYPMPAGSLWIAAGSGTLQEKPLSGQIQIVFPAELLGLDSSEPEVAASPETPVAGTADAPVDTEPEEETAKNEPAATSESQADDASPVESEAANEADNPPPEGGAKSSVETPESVSNSAASEVSEQKLKKILAVVNSKLREEVGGFLGHPFDLKNEEFCMVERDQLFSGLEGTHILAHMKIEGDREGQGYLLVDLNAAIRLGGTLIMLPDSELDSRLESGEYGAEDADAFGEIANIVAGIYTSVFNDLYPGSLRFVKTDQETLDPLVIQAKEEYPFDDTNLYASRGEAFLNDKSLGSFMVFAPTDVLGLKQEGDSSETAAVSSVNSTTTEGEANAVGDQPESGEIVKAADAGASPSAAAGVVATGGDEGGSADSPLFFIYGDSEEDVDSFVRAVEGINLTARFKNVQDGNSDELLGSSVQGVFLVMGDVGEQGIATAIKIHAAVQNRLPLIAAGPNWTRSMVLRAIKYGIQDILVTPASEAQIQEKLREHMSA